LKFDGGIYENKSFLTFNPELQSQNQRFSSVQHILLDHLYLRELLRKSMLWVSLFWWMLLIYIL